MSNGDPLRYEDGARYESMMGTWSRLLGVRFLQWLAADQGLSWLDVGCGNGAFTQLVVERQRPLRVTGIDPSRPQLLYASDRGLCSAVVFEEGYADQLPVARSSFDIAVMALVIDFVPNPIHAVSQLSNAVKSGGTVCAYAWDMEGGGFPMAPIHDEMRGMGFEPQLPPSVSASRTDVMAQLWTCAGLRSIRTYQFSVVRKFKDFNDFWFTSLNSVFKDGQVHIPGMNAQEARGLQDNVRRRMKSGGDGSISLVARANAISGIR